MLNILSQNAGTIIATIVVAVIVALCIYSLIRSKKRGESSCGCNCSHCAMAGKCHSVSDAGIRRS